MVSLALLLALTLAVSGLIIGFIQETGEERTGEVGEQVGEDIQCSNAGIQITDAFFQHAAGSTGTNYTTVVVENTGSTNLPKPVTISAFQSDVFVNSTDMLSALTVGETRSVTFITNTTSITRVSARSQDCTSKTSSLSPVANETYVSEPETGVS